MSDIATIMKTFREAMAKARRHAYTPSVAEVSGEDWQVIDDWFRDFAGRVSDDPLMRTRLCGWDVLRSETRAEGPPRFFVSTPVTFDLDDLIRSRTKEIAV